jgi:hypothetical protein
MTQFLGQGNTKPTLLLHHRCHSLAEPRFRKLEVACYEQEDRPQTDTQFNIAEALDYTITQPQTDSHTIA